MKITSALLVAVAVVLAASTASALPTIPTGLPLKLMSVSGTAHTTANYGSPATATSNPYKQVSFNYKTLLSLISNQVYLNTRFEPTGPVIVPMNVDLMFDPVSLQTYLTNNLGFYYPLSDNGFRGNIAFVRFYEMATSFKGDFYAGSENDVVGMELVVIAYGADGLHYEIDIYGTGKMTATYGGKLPAILTKKSMVSMTLSLQNGSGYAEYQGSDDGVVNDGQFTFSGSGSAPASVFPYSAWWWSNYRN
jgi:hypothetical protein